LVYTQQTFFSSPMLSPPPLKGTHTTKNIKRAGSFLGLPQKSSLASQNHKKA